MATAPASDPAQPPVLRRGASERERIAEAIARRVDVPMSVLGVVFLLLVVIEYAGHADGALAVAFQVAGWVLWAAFAAEFALRMVIAPSTAEFLRRNWWQLAFLLVPFLRFLRVVRAVRAARLGRVLTSAVRSTRSARRRLSGRIASLAAVTAIVVLAGSLLLFETADFASYGDALYAAALATIAGEHVPSETAVPRVVDVALVTYSVVVFATLAATVGAYLVDRAGTGEAPDPAGPPGPDEAGSPRAVTSTNRGLVDPAGDIGRGGL